MEQIDSSVIFSSNSKINLQKITNVNNKNVYQIDLGDCIRYISPENSPMYIGIIHNDMLNIFNLIEDGVFDESFKLLFKNIDKTKVQILAGKLRTADSNRIISQIIQFFNSIHDFSYIQKFSCPKFINLDAAKAVINDLNIELNKICPDFKINIDYFFNLKESSIVTTYSPPVVDTLLLCLFNGNNCVSSVTVKFNFMDPRKIDIDSRTDIRYEGRKFNKLLRSVIIIISKAFDERKQFITSEAINPISAYLMIKSLNALSINSSGELLDKTSTFDEIKTAIESQPNKSIISTVELSVENIENAKAVFNRTITEINCASLFAEAISDVNTDIKSGGKRKNKQSFKRKNRRKSKKSKRKRAKKSRQRK